MGEEADYKRQEKKPDNSNKQPETSPLDAADSEMPDVLADYLREGDEIYKIGMREVDKSSRNLLDRMHHHTFKLPEVIQKAFAQERESIRKLVAGAELKAQYIAQEVERFNQLQSTYFEQVVKPALDEVKAKVEELEGMLKQGKYASAEELEKLRTTTESLQSSYDEVQAKLGALQEALKAKSDYDPEEILTKLKGHIAEEVKKQVKEMPKHDIETVCRKVEAEMTGVIRRRIKEEVEKQKENSQDS